MSFYEFQAVKFNLAKAEKSLNVWENNKDEEEINVHLAEILDMINPFDFAPALTLHSRFIFNLITNDQTSVGQRMFFFCLLCNQNQSTGNQNWTNQKAAKYWQLSMEKSRIW